MIRPQAILIVVLLLPFQQLGAQSKNQDRNVKIKVPIAWVDEVRNYDFKQNNTTLIKAFESFIHPDSLVGSDAYSHEEGGIFNPFFVDLDGDQKAELIALFGWSESYPTLAVFKQIDHDWFLLYFEPFYMFYNEPELQIANSFSKNKTFYIRWLYERGSGIYCDAYHFYKILNNRVYPCLELINKAHIFGWGLYLNQTVEMDFKFNCVTSDDLFVSYRYNFFPGAVYESDLLWNGHEDISFVKGENGINYQWDTVSNTYRPQVYDRQEALTEEKISCFGAFGNDTLFVRAFDYEIHQTLETGTLEQKTLLQKYLELVKKEHKAVAPAGEMEEKVKIGDLKFYDIKKKE